MISIACGNPDVIRDLLHNQALAKKSYHGYLKLGFVI